jgi:hypothetical protein
MSSGWKAYALLVTPLASGLKMFYRFPIARGAYSHLQLQQKGRMDGRTSVNVEIRPQHKTLVIEEAVLS